MTNYKIVSDSAADMLTFDRANYACVPLKIITEEKEYIDDATLDVAAMVTDLQKYKGRSRSSCPNVAEWKQAFGDCDTVFCVAITSGLSGSYNAANIALNEYLQEKPGRKGYVIDTLSAGPEQALIIEKLQELVTSQLSFAEIVEQIEAYKNKTSLLFALESLRNFANNGRVNNAVAKLTGVLGIRVVGRASQTGTLEIVSKSKGSKKVLHDVMHFMLKAGFAGGKVRIHHCQNQESAAALTELIRQHYKNAPLTIVPTKALCSFYAESGGFLVGFETV